MTLSLAGLFPPVPTPFDRDGELDLDAFSALLRALEPEVDGVVVLGSNGEAAYLGEAERDAVVAAARGAWPAGKPLIVGTGGETTRLVVDRQRRAADGGADATLVLAPHYFRPQMTDEVLAAHYETVADASPLPLLLYNIPGATGGLALSPGLIARLARHERVIGLKDSSGNVGSLVEIVRLAPAGFTVLTGNAPTLLAAASLGAAGGILAVANVAAPAYRTLLEHAAAGRTAEAAALQTRLNPLALAVTSRFGVPGLKAALARMGRPAGVPRAPLQPLPDAAVREIEAMLDELGLLVA